MKTNVVIVDDHVSVRQMLAVVLAREGLYEVVGEAGTGFEAMKICRKVKPALVILDLLLPEMNGVEVLRRLREEARGIRVLIYSGTHSRELILDALRAQPHGFVHKEDTLVTLREALRAAANGCVYFTSFATDLLNQTLGEMRTAAPLTARERAVLQMLAEGMSNKEMADRLTIAAKTVEHHRAHLMEKLGLHDVAKLTRYAVGAGIVSVEL